MIRVTVLGTSGASPTRQRGLAAVSLFHDGSVFLFDCGEGTQMQILKYDVNSSRIKAIFISHAHGDHVIGLAGLVRTLALNGRKELLQIYVPGGSEKVVRNLIVFDRAIMTYPIEIKGVKPGIVYRGKDFTVSAFSLRHTITTYGYVFKMNDKRRFIVEKAKRMGIKGEMFSVLQKKGSILLGKRRVRIADLTTLHEGKKIVYASDTRPSESTVKAARDADLLLHESTYAEKERDLAAERGHSTAKEAATIARKAKVKKLVLIHFSARYRDTRDIESEARKIFAETVAAKDGYSITI